MKPLTSHGARIGALALAAQLLFATVGVPAWAQTNPDAPARGEPITLNFNNAEIESVARTIAVVTGRDVVVDPRVKGTMNLVTDRPITPANALNQFAAALRLQGFAIVDADGLYKVVPEAEAKLQSNTVTTSTSGIARAGSNQIVTQVFKLNYESANTLLPVLRPLIAPNNTINANPGNNSLVITDYAENMRRLARIIAALDVPNAADLEIIPLRHSIATDLAPLVTKLVEGETTSAPGAAPGITGAAFKTTILAEPRSNALIIRAANPARSQLVRSLVEKLDKAPLESANGAAGNIYVVYLKNADATKLATTLRAAMASDAQGQGQGNGSALNAGGNSSNTQPMQQLNNANSQSGMSTQSTAPLNNTNQVSTGGQIQADPTTNSLIITASEPQYRQLRAVIDKLDGRRAQVMVEALIAEVNAEKAAQFGIQWQGLLGGKSNQYIGNNSGITGANILTLSLGNNGTATGTPATGLNIGIGATINGQSVLGFLANFLESNDEGNILSTPNLLTLDNEEAKIVIGQNVPFPTGQYANTGGVNTINPFTTVERKDVGLTLRVRPTINEDNTVRMQIFQEVSTIQSNTLNNINGPTTNKRSIESNVLVDDGSLIVIGGLLQDEYGNTTDKVPLAGDIPVVGALFRNEQRTRKKTNLMVFLRPVVVRDTNASNALAYDRYDAIRSLQTATQPAQDNIFLNSVSSAPIVPPVMPTPSSSKGASDRRIEGTRLIPPPVAPLDPPRAPSPLKGALPPTGDPASSRELP